MTDSKFKKLLQEYKESGLSVRDFCANQDFAVSTFYYWMKKQNKKVEAPKEFLPLLIGEQYVPDRRGSALPAVNKGNKEGDSVPLEFVFPNGTKMILKASIDPALLKTIVHLYD